MEQGNKIAFSIFTYNEENRIAQAIKNLIPYGNVFILDGGSTDNTKNIAESLGARFVTRPTSKKPFVEQQENLDLIRSLSNAPYIYWGYADNILPNTLLRKMAEIAEQGKYKKIECPMWTYLWGNTAKPAYKSHLSPLFHRDAVSFENNSIHRFGTFLGTQDQVIRLPSRGEYAIRHHSLYNEEKFVSGYMRYANEEASAKYIAGEKFSVIKLLAAMIRYAWIYRRSILCGKEGLITILNQAFGRVMTYTRLYEIEHDVSLSSISKSYSLAREEIINSNHD